MSSHTTDTPREKGSTDAISSGRHQLRKLVIALTVLVCIAIGSMILYAISLIRDAVTLIILAALLSYLIYPLVRFLQRRLRRSLAIAIAYLLVVSVLMVGIFLVTSSLIRQSSSLAHFIQFLSSPAGERQTQSLTGVLGTLGLTKDQTVQFTNHLLSQAQGALSGVIPFLSGLLNNIVNLIVVVTLSVYFVFDGPGIISWLNLKTPITHRGTMTFLLHALDQSIGGYFRGSFFLALIGALSTGVGLTLLHIPYAALLGALFFLLYFVPVIGGYIIGALCMLAALPEGWVATLIVAVSMMLLQGIVMGQILAPRIFSRAVGVHPIMAIFALIAGAELFGLLGGFLAVPVVGVLQQIIVALWHWWKHQHPELFPSEEVPLPQATLSPEQQSAPTDGTATDPNP
ncbi:AI-2E family transporter [Reticulibacter mediterranei]|uniref:AI-2E family transporter n=1 Tax=Reticulibacter mediterranei TaxID=2778369 RepID=A0A8J3N692_9CHLR|nr:AI-2E family transporter [Reticulibacter mediterranei]GHP00118.1 AI-2E family transporter [Reticulibacter mediterranei]